MCNLTYFIVFCQCLVVLYGQRDKTFFRKDYTYIEETQSFYKIHTIQKSWHDAKNVCEMEGAKMFYPEDAAESAAVINFWNRTQPFYWVFIGVSDQIVKGVFETIDGTSLSDAYENWASGEPNDAEGKEACVELKKDGFMNDVQCGHRKAFICKKTLSSLQWNTICNVPNPDYIYSQQTGKCYKFHLKPKNWLEAYAHCSAEQSYLSIIDSDAEAVCLRSMTENAPKDNVKGDYLRGVVLLGFHNRAGSGWATVRGARLEDSGYAKWAAGQPDGGENETCGSMFYNGQLNDIQCGTRAFFICEHDVDLLASIFDERFGQDVDKVAKS